MCGEPTDDDRYVCCGNLVDDAIVDDPAHVRCKELQYVKGHESVP